MTGEDIKEYIDIKIKYYSEIDQNLFTPIINVKREFEEVKRLLDELEDKPKGKWEKQDYSTGYSEYGTASICSKCGSEVISKTNYCSNCGAKMEPYKESE